MKAKIKGIEIIYDNKTFRAGLENRSSIACILDVQNRDGDYSAHSSLTGLDSSALVGYTWLDNKDPKGPIVIKVTEISSRSKPLSKRNRHREDEDKKKVEYYYKLKQELEEKGLI